MAGAAAAGGERGADAAERKRRPAPHGGALCWRRRSCPSLSWRARENTAGPANAANTATSGPLDCSESYDPVAIATDVPGSGGVAHRTPVDLPTGRAGARAGAGRARGCCPVDGGADRRVAGGRSAHAGPGGAGVSRGPVRPAGVRGVGHALVRGPRRARLQPDLPAAGVAAGYARAGRRCACWRRACCSGGWRCAAYGGGGALGRGVVRGGGARRRVDRAPDVRAGRVAGAGGGRWR